MFVGSIRVHRRPSAVPYLGGMRLTRYDLVHESENTMMCITRIASFFGHNATGCINSKKRRHELHEIHELFRGIREIRGESLRRVSPGIPRKGSW